MLSSSRRMGHALGLWQISKLPDQSVQVALEKYVENQNVSWQLRTFFLKNGILINMTASMQMII